MGSPGVEIIGRCSIRSFDQGVVDTIGAILIDTEKDGVATKNYALSISSLAEAAPPEYAGKIPVKFWPPDGPFEPYLLPCVIIRPVDPIPALQRYEFGALQYRLPAAGAEQVVMPDGTVGYTKYEQRGMGRPFDMAYDIEVRTKKRWHKVTLLEYILGRLIDRTLIVSDTAGNRRDADFSLDSVSNADDFSDVADRVLSSIIGIMVQGYIDLDEPRVFPAFIGSAGKPGQITINPTCITDAPPDP